MNYDNLSPYDRKSIAELRSAMGSAGTELLDDILLRFLFARKDWKSENYDIGASAEMLRNHLAWYAAKRPDQLLGQYHCPKFTEYYQCGYHGRDKFGCQVYYERPGAMKVQELFSLYDDDDLMKLHALVVETGRRFYDRAYGGTANGICVVMDLGGISRAHLDKRVFDWIGRASKIDAANYPEHLAHCYIINTGLLTRTAWGMVKPMLEKRTSGKVEFLGGPDQYLPKLRQRMSDDIIPSIFGGGCQRCPNGCLKGVRFGVADPTTVAGCITKAETASRAQQGLPNSGTMFPDLKQGGLSTAPNATATAIAAAWGGHPPLGAGAWPGFRPPQALLAAMGRGGGGERTQSAGAAAAHHHHGGTLPPPPITN